MRIPGIIRRWSGHNISFHPIYSRQQEGKSYGSEVANTLLVQSQRRLLIFDVRSRRKFHFSPTRPSGVTSRAGSETSRSPLAIYILTWGAKLNLYGVTADRKPVVGHFGNNVAYYTRPGGWLMTRDFYAMQRRVLKIATESVSPLWDSGIFDQTSKHYRQLCTASI